MIGRLSNSRAATDEDNDNNTIVDSEREEMDEFVDARDGFVEEEEGDVCDDSDAYDDNVQIVDEHMTFFDDDAALEYDGKLEELGLMINSTLASDYDGANAARLNAHFFNDWSILLEQVAIEQGFPNLEELLKSDNMKDYVEQASSVNGVAIYRAVSKACNEHILRRVADCKLNEDQIAQKRKMHRLLQLKNPENAENFLEGKRRILRILLDLKADEIAVDYQMIRDEYMKRYNTSLNATEHQRLFLKKSALKNFWRVFYREVVVINANCIRLKLRSPNIQIPEEITEDLRLLANIDKIELPTFAFECRPAASNFASKEKTVKYSEDFVASSESILKKPVMDWGNEVKKGEIGQLNIRNQHEDNIENADEMNNTISHGIDRTMSILANKAKIRSVQENSFDKMYQQKLSESTDLNEDKYTGDEESSESSDSEHKAFRKYQKKKFKGNINTFNISSTPSKVQIAADDVERRLSHFEVDANRIQQSVGLMNNGGNKQSTKRTSIAKRTLQQSVIQPQNREYIRSSSSSSINFNSKNSAQQIPEINKLPYGSYSVPNSSSGQRTLRPAEENNLSQGNYYRSSGNVQRPSLSHPNDADWAASMQQMQHYQPNQFQQHDQGYYDDRSTLNEISSTNFSYSSKIRIAQLSKETQTNENWLDILLDELGCHNSKKSALQKLAQVIELLVDVRSPNPILLSALPKIVGSFYGTTLNPEEDRNYLKTWREIVKYHCSAEILIAPLPNGEEVLVKKLN